MAGASLVPGARGGHRRTIAHGRRKGVLHIGLGATRHYGLRLILSDWTHTGAYGKVVQVFARPGRADKKVEFGLADGDTVSRLFHIVYKHSDGNTPLAG
jgi:hypothetical protein